MSVFDIAKRAKSTNVPILFKNQHNLAKNIIFIKMVDILTWADKIESLEQAKTEMQYCQSIENKLGDNTEMQYDRSI